MAKRVVIRREVVEALLRVTPSKLLIISKRHVSHALTVGVNVVWTQPAAYRGIPENVGRCVALDSLTKTRIHHAQTVLMMVPTVVPPRRVPLVKQPEQVFLPSLAVIISLQNQALLCVQTALKTTLNAVR